MFRNPLIDAAVILLVVLLVMGPKRLPGLGKGLGQGMREFKEGITGDSKSDDDEDKPSLTEATAMPEDRSVGDRPAQPTATSGRGSAETGSEQRS